MLHMNSLSSLLLVSPEVYTKENTKKLLVSQFFLKIVLLIIGSGRWEPRRLATGDGSDYQQRQMQRG